MFDCFVCGLVINGPYETPCPRCTAIRAKYPDLVEYIEACLAKKEADMRYDAWEREMGNDICHRLLCATEQPSVYLNHIYSGFITQTRVSIGS